MKIGYKYETCSRCNGTGRYSFNGKHSICYKCNGTKETITYAASRARDELETLLTERLSRPVEEVKPGEFAWFAKNGFEFKQSGYREVVESHEDYDSPSFWTLRVRTTPTIMGYLKGTKVRVYDAEITEATAREVVARHKDVRLIG